MPGNPEASVFIGNLDKKVNERLLYEMMVQAGPLVNLYIPRDKETREPKGYAFAEFITESTASYAVELFSGLVYLDKKPVRFSISGQDKVVQSPVQDIRNHGKRKDRDLLDSSVQKSQKLHIPVCSLDIDRSLSPFSGRAKSSFSGSGGVPADTDVGGRCEISPLPFVQSYSARFMSLDRVGSRSRIQTMESCLHIDEFRLGNHTNVPSVNNERGRRPLRLSKCHSYVDSCIR